MWAKVSDYRAKLAVQRKKKERKVKTSSSSSFSGLAPSMPVPLHNLYGSFDSAIVSTIATSADTYRISYTASSLIMSASPFISPVLSISVEPSRKRKRECSGSSSTVTKEEMWAAFQKFWSSHPGSHSSCDRHSPSICQGPSASSSCPDRHSPAEDFPTSPIYPAQHASPSCPASLAQSMSLTHLVSPISLSRSAFPAPPASNLGAVWSPLPASPVLKFSHSHSALVVCLLVLLISGIVLSRQYSPSRRDQSSYSLHSGFDSSRPSCSKFLSGSHLSTSGRDDGVSDSSRSLYAIFVSLGFSQVLVWELLLPQAFPYFAFTFVFYVFSPIPFEGISWPFKVEFFPSRLVRSNSSSRLLNSGESSSLAQGGRAHPLWSLQVRVLSLQILLVIVQALVLCFGMVNWRIDRSRFVEVVSWIWEICDLPLAPLESRKIHGFQTGLDPDEQPSSSHRFPIQPMYLLMWMIASSRPPPACALKCLEAPSLSWGS